MLLLEVAARLLRDTTEIIMGNLLQNTIIRVRIHRAIIMGEEWIHRLITILHVFTVNLSCLH